MNSDAVSARYSGTAKFLHWLIVGLLIAQYIFAWTMPHIGRTVPVSTLIDLHVSVGLLIMFMAVVRLVVRATHGGTST
jgi:cytochrome b561